MSTLFPEFSRFYIIFLQHTHFDEIGSENNLVLTFATAYLSANLATNIMHILS